MCILTLFEKVSYSMWDMEMFFFSDKNLFLHGAY